MTYEEQNIMHFLNKLKEQSPCVDKQVACVITDRSYKIISIGVNAVVFCDKNCHDKENRTCETIHAEIIACANLNDFNHRAKYAYINLFPCPPCQTALSNFVEEIIVFGKKHKDQVFDNIRLEPDLYSDMLESNGVYKQLSVAQGELAELITAISDYFHRNDKHTSLANIVDEIIDAEFMLDQIKLIVWKSEPEFFNHLKVLRGPKYERLQHLLNEGTI